MPASKRKSAENYLDLDAEPVAEGCTFTLGGREWHCKSMAEAPFSYVEALVQPLDVPGGSDGSPVEQLRGQLMQVEPFFQDMLVPEEVEAFLALLHQRGGPFTFPKVKRAMEFIASGVSGRPTERPSSSPAGSQRTGATSADASSARATHRKQSSGSVSRTRSTRRSASSTTARSKQTA